MAQEKKLDWDNVVLILLGILIIVLIVLGCVYLRDFKIDMEDSTYASFSVLEKGKNHSTDTRYRILVDETTGVLYYEQMGPFYNSITPILNPDGTPKTIELYQS